MRPIRLLLAVACVAAIFSIAIAPARATDIELVSAGAVRVVLKSMVDDYTNKTGKTFHITIGSTGQLRSIIAEGKPADLIIVSAPLMGELEQSGKLTPGSRADIGRIGLGLIVRRGAPEPAIATTEDVKAALLNAKSIVYTDPKLGGTSYLHLLKLAEQFGIANEVTRKGVHASGGDDSVAKVADGTAELAIVLISEINSTGVKLVGLLPEPIQLWTVYSAAVPLASRQPAAARDFTAALTAPAMNEKWRAAGWQPATTSPVGHQ